jgi:hypothetical protein
MASFAHAVLSGQEPATQNKSASVLEQGRAIERPIAGGDAHDYKVSLKAGQFLHLVVDQRGIDVVVRVIGPDGKRIAEVDSPNGDSGPEPVQVVAAAAGDFLVEIRPLEKTAGRGRYQVKIEELLTADQYTERLAAKKAQEGDVKNWLAQHAIRLKGVEAGQGFEDMQPLKTVIGDARLVALGEATHGTREFFQLKHRMLEFLVTEMGFTVFGIEATMPEAFDVNLFVETTTSARPNPAGERPGARKLTAPANLGFETGDPGRKPADWIDSSGANGLSYKVVTSEDNPHTGNRCAMIRRMPGPRNGETFGSLAQTIDAKSFRAKRIRLRAAVRTEVTGQEDQAYLWLHIRKEGIGPTSVIFADDMADRPITTSDWRVFETAGNVPKDADKIDYGLAVGVVGPKR